MSKNVVDMTLRANMDLSQVSSGLSQMQGILKQLKLSPTLKKEFDSLFSTAAADLEKYQAKLQSGFKTKGDITGFEKVAQGFEKSLDKIGVAWSKLQEKDLSKLVKLDSSSIERIQQFDNKFKELEKTLKGNIAGSLKTVVEQINSLSTKTSKQAGLGIAEALGAGEYKEAIALADEYIAKLQKMGAEARGGNYKANLDTFVAIRNEIAKVVSETENYNQEVNKLQVDKLAVMADAAEKTGQKLQQGSTILSGITQKTQEYSRAVQDSGRKTVELGNDIDMLKSRVQYFFSLTNSVMLFRRILQDTIQTTKELDAAMTETAVVTDFSVADMWKDLPRYTGVAKELGATIQGVYETMTLYYQQGLKTNEVFEVGTETLKMAKIAGLDYAQATDFMTAALRGFNMEVNELNAQKVNDVYSELAAITAADTQEIATAMTKTASIASNANMEFETTAAFLSQIIETTRESAETAGTAMKTVIARFTELKKDPAEIGEVDGEIVDANKIETALRTIDVALRDTSGQFRDLDEVFLDIAEKWDGLDTNTQRYIATMAAGSRQQSRFIAMMSDYERTMQLVNAANNSAGASQRQFDKTLESLEAKLNQLKDAWDQFTMGIANNTLIKAGVDALTGLLNIINKITEHLPGATKGIGNLLLMIGGFSAGKKVMDAFFASTVSNIANLGKVGSAAGAAYGTNFGSALVAEFGKTGKTISKIFSKKTWINSGDLFSSSFKVVDKELKDIANNAANLFYSVEEGFDDTLEANAYNKALADRNMLMKAATKDQQTYIALRQAGLPIETAQLALKKELTEEDWEELAIQSLLIGSDKTRDGLTKTEIANRAALLKEKQAELATDKMGILTKAKEIALLFLGSPARKKEAQERLVAAGATWAQKIAIDAYNTSLATNLLLVGLVVAAIVGLTIGIASLIKSLKENSLDYKMEKAAEATEKAKEAAENAKQAYDELNSSIEEIGTKEDELEKLTYGTLEWQKALLEVNQQIMDLINQFPGLKNQLLNELSVEANGRLTLSIDGYNLMKEQSLEYYKNAIAGQSISASYEADLKREKAEQDFYKTAIHQINEAGEKIENTKIEKTAGKLAQNQLITNEANISSSNPFDLLFYLLGGKTVQNAMNESSQQERDFFEKSYVDAALATQDYKSIGVSGDQKDIIYEKFLENPEIFVNVNEDLEAFGKTIKTVDNAAVVSAESLLDFVPAMRQRQAAELEHEATLRAQYQQLLLSTTSENFQNRDDSKQLTDTFSQFFAEQQKDDVQAELDKMNELTNISEYASELGLTNFYDQGSELENLRKMYQELTGFSKEKIEEMYGESTDALKNAIASMKVSKNWGNRVENFAKELDNFNKNLPKNQDLKDLENVGPALKQLFGGANGTGFTKEGLSTFVDKDGNINQTNLETILSNFYESSPTIKQQYEEEYGVEEAYNKFKEWASEMITTGHQAFATAEERLGSLNLKVTEFASGLDSGAIVGLSKKIEDVFYKTGEAGAESLMTQLNTIIESFGGNGAQIKNFTSALLGLDWSSVNDIENFGEVLEKLGVEVDKSVLDNFTSDIIEFNEASNAVKLENLTAELEKLNGIAENLAEREYNDFEFTREEKDALVGIPGINEEDFVGYADTWMYLGDSITNLITAVNENTAAIIGDTIKELEEQHKTSSFLDNPETDTGDLANYSFLGLEDRQSILESLVTQAQNANLTQLGGYNIEQLEKLATTTNLDTYQQDKLSAVLEQLASLLGQSGIIGDKINTMQHENAVQQYATGPTNTMTQDALTETDGGAATDALLTKAKAYTQLNDEVVKYNKLLKEGNIEKANEIKREIAAGVAIAEKAKKLDELDDKISDNIDSLENMDKESAVYEETLEDTATMLNEIFDSDIDKEFISGDNIENLNLLQEGLNGSQEAWNQFVLNMQDAKIQAEGFAEQFGVSANQILNAVASLDASSFDIDGTADMTQVVQSLLNAGMTGEQVATFLEALGYTNIELVVDNNITGLEGLEEGTDLSSLGGSVTISAVNSYVPAASMAGQFGGGGGSSGGGGGGGGGGGDSGSEEEPWKNSFDKFYNITEDINELLEKRNELETEYDLILQNQNASIGDYLKNYIDRIKSFKEEIALQEEMLRLRERDQEEILSEYSHLSEYAWVEDGAVYIDYEAIDRVEDQELGEEIEEFVSALEENDEAIQEANDAISENTLAIEELLDDWRDATADFEQRVFDAIVAEREKEIEKLEEASDALEESNSELISAIQKEINERRQQRENEEAEQDLAEKERRLAYLQQDTSGAYDSEILQLEKDLKQQKEDYTDTLIDQRIADLEEQNDEAAKQREKQIQIAQYQLKNEQENGVIARQVSQLLKEANSDAGWNRVWRLLEKSEGFKGLTDTNKAVWTEDTQVEFKEAMAYLNGLDGGGIAAALANISVGSYDSYTDLSSNTGDDGYDSEDHKAMEQQIIDLQEQLKDEQAKNYTSNLVQVSEIQTDANGSKYYKIKGKWYKSSDTTGFDEDEGTTTLKDGAKAVENIMIKSNNSTRKIVLTVSSQRGGSEYISQYVSTESINGKTYYKYNNEYYTKNPLTVEEGTLGTFRVVKPGGLTVYKKYKTGGLADYTGPAWLDGTKSRPELVLNQKDTQNFLQLKDVLSSFMKQNQITNNTSSNGDTIYDISISVEKMSSDYDVEQVASKIKQMISNDALYRNSTMINRLR